MNDNSRLFCGIDIGSLSSDGVVIDENQTIVAHHIEATGVSGVKASEKVLHQLCLSANCNPEDIDFTVSTGYGRERVPFTGKAITEITCHARGANYWNPQTTIVIDIGGQDSKVIRIDKSGRVVDFAMNDRCAAGTGRFLEVMARALEVELIELGERSTRAKASCQISSICTVFAESEVVSLLAQGHPINTIIRGLHEAIARRTIGLLQRVRPLPSDAITISGGVAHNSGVVEELEKIVKMKIFKPAEPQITGALGAAIIAREDYFKQ